MFDDADEGVTEEYFHEAVDEEYLMIIPEDDVKPYPPFEERLLTVKQKHGIF